MFGDRRVDHAHVAEFFQQPLRDFVGTLILRDFLAHQEHGGIATHFFRHRITQRLAHRHGDKFGAVRNVHVGERGLRGLRIVRLLRRGLGTLFFDTGFDFCFGLGLFASGLFRLRSSDRFGFLSGVAIGQQGGDRIVDLHAFGAFGNQNLPDLALIDGFEFHRSLVGFDLGQNIAGLYRVAFLHQPFGQLALFHRGR